MQTIEPRPSVASKKFMSEANSESLLFLLKVTKILTKKLPLEWSEERLNRV